MADVGLEDLALGTGVTLAKLALGTGVTLAKLHDALRSAPVYLIPDVTELMGEILRAAAKKDAAMVPYMVAYGLTLARYAHHAAGVIYAVKNVQKSTGLAVNWSEVTSYKELASDKPPDFTFEQNVAEYTSPSLLQIYTDALVVIAATHKDFPQKWEVESYPGGQGYLYHPGKDDFRTERRPAFRTQLFSGLVASWPLAISTSATYLLAVFSKGEPSKFPRLVLEEWQQQQAGAQQGQVGPTTGHALVTRECDAMIQEFATTLTQHTNAITVREFIRLLRVEVTLTKQQHEWLSLLESLSWRDFLRAVALSDSVTCCHLTFIPLPFNYPSLVLAPLTDQYIGLVLAAECAAVNQDLMTRSGAVNLQSFLLWERSSGSADSCLRTRRLGKATDSEQQTSEDGVYQFYHRKWESREWVVPVHEGWQVQVADSDTSETKRAKLVALVKSHTAFLLQHRPGVLSKTEATQLIDAIENGDENIVSEAWDDL